MTDDVQAFMDVGVVLKELKEKNKMELKGGKVVGVSKNIFDAIKKPWQKFWQKIDETVFYSENQINEDQITEEQILELKEELLGSEKIIVLDTYAEPDKYLKILKGKKIDLIFSADNTNINNVKINILEEEINRVEAWMKNHPHELKEKLEVNINDKEELIEEKISETQPEIDSKPSFESLFPKSENEKKDDNLFLETDQKDNEPEMINLMTEQMNKKIDISDQIDQIEVEDKVVTPFEEKTNQLEIELEKHFKERRDCIQELEKYVNTYESAEKEKLKEYLKNLDLKINQLSQELNNLINQDEEIKEVAIEEVDLNDLESYQREKRAVKEELMKHENSYMSEEKDKLNKYLAMLDEKINELEKLAITRVESDGGLQQAPDESEYKINQFGEIVAEDEKTELDIVVESLEVMASALEKAIVNLKKHRDLEKNKEQAKQF